MASIYTYNFMSPTGTSGVDVNLVNSNLRVTGAPPVNIKQATISQFLDPITELREQFTITPTTSTGIATYSFRIQQVNRGRNISKVFSYTTSGVEANTVISARLASIVALDPELSVTVGTPGATFTITAAGTGVDLVITVISAGAGLTAPLSFVNAAGSVVTLANATATSQTASGTVNNVGTITATSSNLANGMVVRYTLISGDSFTFADGSVVNTVGATVDLRIGNVSGSAFDIGPLHDSNIELFTLAATAARTLSLVPSFVRGTGAELANRGIVGATAATVYAEMKLNWLETPPNGGAPISKSHSVFVDTTTSANYGPFRYRAVGFMRGTAASTTAFNSTATNESAAIL